MSAIDDPEPGTSPDLIWSDQDAPRSARFGDVYFSSEDGLAESRTVFLEGCVLRQAFQERDHVCVAELGFGTGLNMMAVIELWLTTRRPGAWLSLFTIEAWPLSAEQAKRVLDRLCAESGVARRLVETWPGTTPGFHRVAFNDWGVSLDVFIGEVLDGLQAWSGKADAWFLDGFSPAQNPQMWRQPVLEAVAHRSEAGARLATFTVAGAVRRGLEQAGFTVEKRPGHGRKRERLEGWLAAYKAVETKTLMHSTRRIAVIGGGIAAASVVRALVAYGAPVTVYEAERIGSGASGFPAALVTPRLDTGDLDIAGLFSQALERARDLYAAIPQAVIAHGVVQYPGSARDIARFGKISQQPIWRPQDMVLYGLEQNGLAMNGALVVHPASILDAWLGTSAMKAGRVDRLESSGDIWRLYDSEGALIDVADTVVLAGGAGTRDLLPDLPLSPVRGQADWVQANPLPAQAWGGYVAPTQDGFLFGATHDRGDTDTDIRASDSKRNLATLSTRLPDAGAVVRQAWASSGGKAKAAIRSTTPDRLPVCGAIAGATGLWVLGGLGSRGFCAAPLLGEHLASLLMNRPSPLSRIHALKVSPNRFNKA